MIPKVIHYCWFGKGEMTSKSKKCISSWKKFCPDYSIVEWNEDNFNISAYPYAQYCYENKMWAFLSDFVRLVVVYENGGLYFDTDVEVVKPMDELLQNEAFYGFETPEYINTGLGFGAIKNHVTVKAMIDVYENLHSVDGVYPVSSCPRLNTEALCSLGLDKNGMLQNVCGALVLPIEYLNPYDDPTGRLNVTSNTYSIHWYAKSWLDKKTVLRSKITKPFHRLFGTDCFRK